MSLRRVRAYGTFVIFEPSSEKRLGRRRIVKDCASRMCEIFGCKVSESRMSDLGSRNLLCGNAHVESALKC